jgi:hypothetical protein
MKLGVLTFHRSINYGSYWQARCLIDGLRARGHDAELLDHDSLDARRAELRCAFRPELPRRTPRLDYPRYAAKTRRFLAAFEQFRQSPRFPLDRPEEAGCYDIILIGSDEVWNFRHPWYGSKPIFFGERLRADRLVSYAASFGNHEARDGIHPDWARKLDRFAAISVRDANSAQLIREGLGREAVLALDPCLQFPPAEEKPLAPERPYLALYGHSFPPWFVRSVQRCARASGLPIVSIGYRNDWADMQRVEAGPEEFSALIQGADAVATNFFHGCIFALHHRRPFVAAPSDYRARKVHDLTQELDAADHFVSEATPPEAFAHLLHAALSPAIHERIATLRSRSEAYLDAALG